MHCSMPWTSYGKKVPLWFYDSGCHSWQGWIPTLCMCMCVCLCVCVHYSKRGSLHKVRTLTLCTGGWVRQLSIWVHCTDEPQIGRNGTNSRLQFSSYYPHFTTADTNGLNVVQFLGWQSLIITPNSNSQTYPSTEWGSLVSLLDHQRGDRQPSWIPCSWQDLSHPPPVEDSMSLPPMDWNLVDACGRFDTIGIRQLSSHLLTQYNRTLFELMLDSCMLNVYILFL